MCVQGKYSELMNTKGAGQPGIVTYAWGLAMAGGLVAAVTVGPLADRHLLRPVYVSFVRKRCFCFLKCMAYGAWDDVNAGFMRLERLRFRWA